MADFPLPNPDFTTGLSGWTTYNQGASSFTWSPTGGVTTPGCARFAKPGAGGEYDDGSLTTTDYFPVLPSQSVNASASFRLAVGSDGSSCGINIHWYDSNKALLSTSSGPELRRYQVGSNWVATSVSGSAPPNAAFCRLSAIFNVGSGNTEIFFDDVRWNHSVSDASLSFPQPITYGAEDTVPFRVDVTGISGVASVRYYAEDTGTATEALVGTATTAPWAINTTTLATGSYVARAEVVLTNGTVLDTNTISFFIGTPTPPETREYRGSNAYTYLVLEDFQGLGSQIPSTALVTGMQVQVNYDLLAIARSKDLGVADPASSTADVIFDITNNGTVEAVLLDKNQSSYTALGAGSTADIPLLRSDFSVAEQGLSEGKKWTVFEFDAADDVTVGSSDTLLGGSSIAVGDFLNKAVGIRFYPNLAAKPAYADTGDGAFRFFINSIRVSVYFDSGTVEYYFASPDKEDIIKGTLTASYIMEGELSTGDASGVLQLTPELEVMEGSQTWIGNDWTIHAAYPPTDNNQIGLVGEIEGQAEVGMQYNALPTQHQVKENRSRYQFITENFYGAPDLNSIYGVHGLERAFAYNGDYFYKIYTQADPEKDSPRSVANHHGHLALGFNGGRVDISVVGEPYNFEGVMGASSWAFGDKVVGLLPLSGTILGVFGAKSIWGISGTTVDNFATQVISPNIGAIEYTICDMGFPVYANAYGIYTLSQTQQYGDYLGQPMSKDISPWIRPRLLRKPTSDKEVVCAFPVRSKNQYRICFSDGYVTSMTLNGQQMPTFSFQKYFNGEVCVPRWVDLQDYTGWWDWSGQYANSVFSTRQGPSGGGWMVEFESPVRIRITSEEYWASPSALYENGFIINTVNEQVVIENESGDITSGFVPMPIEQDGVLAVYYTGAEDNSDATVESTDYRVQVWHDCDGAVVPETVYDYPSLVPAAVSSELDNHGEERIHIAPYEDVKFPPQCTFVVFGEGVGWYNYTWPTGYSPDSPILVTLKRTGETAELSASSWSDLYFVWWPDNYYDWQPGDEVVFTQPETGWEFEAVICEEPFLYLFMERVIQDESGEHFYVWNEGAPWADTNQNLKITYDGTTYDAIYHIYGGSWAHTIESGNIPLPLTRVPATVEFEDGSVRQCLLYTYTPPPS